MPITDLAVKSGNLVAATQGRGFWILDDLKLVQQIKPGLAKEGAYLFAPSDATSLARGRSRSPRNAGTNPTSGAVFHYLLVKEPPADATLKLEILDPKGAVVRTFTRKPAPGAKSEDKVDSAPDDDRKLEAGQGLNRFEWDLRYPSADRFPKLVMWNSRLAGPRAVPGQYRARLTLGEWSRTVQFNVVPDPLSESSHEDRVAQFDFLLAVRDKLTETHNEVKKIRNVRKQVSALKRRLKDREDTEQLQEAADQLLERMKAVEEALYQTKNRSRQDPLNFPIRLNDKLAGVASVASSGDMRPTRQAYEVKDELTRAIDDELAKLQDVWTKELPALNRLVRDAGVPQIATDQ